MMFIQDFWSQSKLNARIDIDTITKKTDSKLTALNDFVATNWESRRKFFRLLQTLG